MVTVRRENTTCDIRGIGAYGIIVAQERNQVMDSGGTPGTNPKKERNRRRRFRDIGRALCRCSIIADRERCVNPSVCCVAGNRIGSQPSRFRAGRPEGAMEHNRSTTTFIFKASSHHGLSTPWWLLTFRHAPAMGKKPGLRNPEPRGQPGCASIEDLGRPSRLDNMAVLRQKEAERR
ncbi:MAG: hypothetical protein ACLSGS_00050 [Adlercreutzia sp.]